MGKGRVRDVCRLCLVTAELCKSHILSDFLYDALYEYDPPSKHRILHLSVNPDERETEIPTGVYERMLCEDCEGRLSGWETYGRGVLRGGASVAPFRESWGVRVEGVDYTRFKLFGMSLLWRAAASRRPEFERLALGPHEERLRRLLDSGQPGHPWEYGWAMFFPGDQATRAIMSFSIVSPWPCRYDGHRLLFFGLGAITWVFVASSHMKQMAPSFFALSRDGRLRVVSGGEGATEFHKLILAKFVAAREARKASSS